MQHQSERRLNDGQLKVLDLLFKFRFGTSELIAKTNNKENGTATRSRLNILTNRGLIGRHYEGSDRLQGRYAAYYLLPDGLRALSESKKREDIAEPVVKSVYKNKDVSREFVNHCLTIFEICTKLEALYGDNIKTFTKSELANYDYFPRPLPSAFISLKAKGVAKRFFLESIEAGTPGFALSRRLKQYAEYYAGDEWDATGSDFPAILLVCSASSQEKKMQKRIGGVSEELDIYSTTLPVLVGATIGNDGLWANDPEENKQSLKEL